jgi:hypothetical protein
MSDVNTIRTGSDGRVTHQTVTVVDQHGDVVPEPAEPVIGAPDVRTTVKETTTVADDPVRARARRVRRGILFTVNLIAILITIRIVLALLGANPESPFAAFMYTITEIFTFPFHGLFGAWTPPAYGVMVFEASSLVAIAIYYLLGWIALRIQAIRDHRIATTRTEVVDRETKVQA